MVLLYIIKSACSVIMHRRPGVTSMLKLVLYHPYLSSVHMPVAQLVFPIASTPACCLLLHLVLSELLRVFQSALKSRGVIKLIVYWSKACSKDRLTVLFVSLCL